VFQGLPKTGQKPDAESELWDEIGGIMKAGG